MNDSHAPILCFGEVLWDCLPEGLFLGGAPINVAYHLHRLGSHAVPVTAVGNDFLGDEIVRRLRAWKIPIESVYRHPGRPTGAVIVALDGAGQAGYTFLDNVAWDEIELSSVALESAEDAAAVIYGSLAQRSPHNRRQLARLLERGRSAMKVFDVNLRPPFDAPEIVWPLTRGADLIKLNNEELQRLLGRRLELADFESAARSFAQKTGCARICVTAGSHGAGLLDQDAWLWAPAKPVPVADTVGAGDAFLAALVHGLTSKQRPESSLGRACRLAEFVASRRGATPAYTLNATGALEG